MIVAAIAPVGHDGGHIAASKARRKLHRKYTKSRISENIMVFSIPGPVWEDAALISFSDGV